MSEPADSKLIDREIDLAGGIDAPRRNSAGRAIAGSAACAIAGGFVAAVPAGILGGAFSTLDHGGWDAEINGPIAVISGATGAVGGSIAALIASAFHARLVRPWETMQSWILATSMVLVGGVTLSWFVVKLFLGSPNLLAWLIMVAMAAFVGWADSTRPGRRPASWRSWLLALIPLLIGVAVIFWPPGKLGPDLFPFVLPFVPAAYGAFLGTRVARWLLFS